MHELIRDVMDLQGDYSSGNTEEMHLRGILIRDEIPAWLREHALRLGVHSNGFAVQGKDAIGLKSAVPWVRIYDPELSPRSTDGWYVVYLFSADGGSCYLALSHGSTRWDNGTLRPRTREESASLMLWAKEVLGEVSHPGITSQIDLAAPKGSVGATYAATTVMAIRYSRDALPVNETLLADLEVLLTLLARLYRADAIDPAVPGKTPPEVDLVVGEIDDLVRGGRRNKGGQGFGLTKAQQIAVEHHAVLVASQHLRGLGWSVRDVGAKESFDLDCSRGPDRLKVEVKGTTSLGESVILTRNEVELHRKDFPNTGLIVVSRIVLDKDVDPPVAAGGTLEMVSPWKIDIDDLDPIAYRYTRRLSATAGHTLID